ncbi:LCP family protein [Clostridium sp. LIBA-8841]|uniref:LCP family protein n=1 Tax=Clostridium sp. LIBA-8841 TaxID=2987530 RepID=UPI002AC6A317|nr:LCP family protein [Clostridium sp. LIBA-8841]MDZ5255262.1 LCP family protein [Clostridium sp. LIBA-8841]
MSKGKIIKITFITIFFVFLAIVGLGMWGVSNFIGKMEKIQLDEKNLGVNEEVNKNITNIALFGIDDEDGQGRSDSIMILTIDELHKKLKLTSIMRDSYVEIPGREGKDKINHAYAFGGAELAIKTLNQNFGLNIKDFMAVKMESLPVIVDKLGGVDINIQEDEVDFINGVDSSGVYNLNGEQALAYARIRYTDGGDARRTERQRNILNSIFEKLKLTPLEEYPSIIGEFLPYIQTSLGTGEVLSTATTFATLIPNGLEQARFPRDKDIENIEVNGIYYLDFDNEVVKDEIKNYIFENKLD